MAQRRHHWSNNPNNAHKVCTICGCRCDIHTNKRGLTDILYTLPDEATSTTAPECKTLIDYSEFY